MNSSSDEQDAFQEPPEPEQQHRFKTGSDFAHVCRQAGRTIRGTAVGVGFALAKLRGAVTRARMARFATLTNRLN